MPDAVVSGCILAGQYQDSVRLMRASEALRALDGVDAVGVVMGTPRNLEVLAEARLLFDGAGVATPNDVVVAVRGESAGVADAIARAAELVRQPSGSSGARQFASVASAIAAVGGSPALALVSVNGQYAAGEARTALEHGLDVMIFSDNVPLAEEIALKGRAAKLGRLVMGPDCGTAIVSGVGLGFANRVPRGPVGIIAASGTGAQAVTSHLAARGVGVSHVVGLGGRDLEDEVGGATLLPGLAALDTDPATDVIVLVAKKAGQVAFRRLLAAIPQLHKPLVTCLLGEGPWWVAGLFGAHPAPSLAEAAARARLLTAGTDPVATAADLQIAEAWRERLGGSLTLQGRFAGGTLAQEAVDVASLVLGNVDTNLPALTARGGPHVILDLGADEFTVGRPHPMINPVDQAHQLREALSDPSTGVVLFDVVLGDGCHEDPAGELAPELKTGLRIAHDSGRLAIAVCSVCGTEDDPQSLSRQVQRLQDAGVYVASTNAEAAVLAATALTPPMNDSFDAPPELLRRPLGSIVNIGSSWFTEALAKQDVDVLHVDWRPPAQGDAELGDLLKALG